MPPSAARPRFHPLRLLLVADSLDIGGAERHVVGLASALARAGHTVTIACASAGLLAPIAEQDGVTVRPLLGRPVKRRVELRFAWKLARLVRAGEFDLVHAHMYASAAAAALATLCTGVPLVLTEHSEAGWRTRHARWCSRRVYHRAARVIAVSNGIRDRLVGQDGVSPQQVSVIRNALFAASEPDLATLSALPFAPRQGPFVGVVARLQPEKGLLHFLEAAAQVTRHAPEATFLVVGDGPLRDELTASAARLGLGERVHFLGCRTDAPRLVGLLDVLAVPSLSEGTPLVILEAMAAGVPVVASAVGGIPEQIRHEREGLLVPPAAPSALGQAIHSLLDDPAWARRLGEAGRQRVTSRFSDVAMLRQTEAVYRGTLREAARSTSGRESPVLLPEQYVERP